MADVTRISGVLFESISKVGPTAKSAITKIGGTITPPTCTEYEFGYNSRESRGACRATVSAIYYHDETSGTLYSDKCGGTEAADGYYANRDGYREYIGRDTGGELSGILGAC
jgi:hypothetical protein